MEEKANGFTKGRDRVSFGTRIYWLGAFRILGPQLADG
jgi:hypothetical protein